MKDTKTALRKFSSSINLMIILGSSGVTIGFAIYVSGAQRQDAVLMSLGSLLFVASLAFFSLAIIGGFLTHSSAVIVEALENKQMDSASAYANISFTTDGPKD